MTNDVSGFGAIIRRQAKLGEKVAFSDVHRAVTFEQFADRVNRLVDALHRSGLRRGDRIAILSRNCVSAVECLATTKAGFVPVPMNWRLGASELIELIKDCAPSALVCDDYWTPVAEKEILPAVEIPLKLSFGQGHTGWKGFDEFVGSGDSDMAYPEAEGHETAFLIYTSGTTGTPKAAMLTHTALIANGVASATEAIDVTENDTILCVMPLFHVGGLCYYLLASYMAGATSILRPAFEVDDLIYSLVHLGVTNVHLVPTMVSDLVSHPEAATVADRLQRIVYAGSAMPVALLERAMKVFRTCAFSQSYGSTEAGILTTLGPDEHRRAANSPEFAHLLQSCGRPLKFTALRIVDADGKDCADNQLGEVLVKCERSMAGYWNLPEKTAEVFTDGYLRTGDIGYRDRDGYLYLVDRKNDMIVTGGENVFPSEVENVLYRSPDVAEAVVFGVSDGRWIERVVAAVVLREGSRATEKDLVDFARQHLASYKCPKSVYIVKELPRSGAGKVSRKHLRQIYSQGNSSGSS